jgi:hypothetical protein
MRRLWWIGVLVAVMTKVALANPAKKACQQDQIRFCNGKMDRACLMSHINELSANCKSWLEANSVGKAVGMKNQAVTNANDVKVACSGDIAQLCASSMLGGYGKCLSQNYEKLSAGCKQAVDRSKSTK